MLKTFFDDLSYLPKKKFNAKYTVPFIVALLSLVLIGQFIAILTPLAQLNKTSGRIVQLQTIVTYRTYNRWSSHDTPNYGLAITLDNTNHFVIQEDDARKTLDTTLKIGDQVTIYYPTLTLKIIGAGLLRHVSEVERGNKVLYSWKFQQHETWYLVLVLSALIALFYWLIGYLRNYVDTRPLR